ncbi:MAG: helix-turn-helix domain-containing protein [Proteobacteria bacterium]|nr:helix-turn-helix domain-containing protein [Pseudomonadota bacterium]
MRALYYLLYVKDRPSAIVRVKSRRAIRIIGSDVATSFFADGQPRTEVAIPVCFVVIATECWQPTVCEWIDHFQTREKRKVPASVPPHELCEVIILRCKGVSVRKLADKYGVSVSTIKRICAADHNQRDSHGDVCLIPVQKGGLASVDPSR